MAVPTTPLIDKARDFLARELGGTWDDTGAYLLADDNELHVGFDDRAGTDTRLWLYDLDVTIPGKKLGTRTVEALRRFCDQEGIDLHIGPIISLGFWDASRFPWLAEIGDDDGDPIYGYTPSDRGARNDAPIPPTTNGT